nr:restriction endonuclease [Candidatus Neomarinimicrobiota bacterium]
TIQKINDESQLDMLNILVEGRRLRDISDLPFDLVI